MARPAREPDMVTGLVWVAVTGAVAGAAEVVVLAEVVLVVLVVLVLGMTKRRMIPAAYLRWQTSPRSSRT